MDTSAHASWYRQNDFRLYSDSTYISHRSHEQHSLVVQGIQRVRAVLGGGSATESRLLLEACARNDIEEVQYLLETIDCNVLSLKKVIHKSALFQAVLNPKGRPLVRLLCRHGADPDVTDKLGRSPIHYAASVGHLDIMVELLALSNFSVSELIDRNGRCPLMYACGEGHQAVCQWLINHEGADCARVDNQGRSPLVYASRSGNAAIIALLLSKTFAESTNDGWHPLHYACLGGKMDAIRTLMALDRQSALAVTNSGHSTLFIAMHAENNSQEMTRHILDANLLVNLTPHDVESIECSESLVLLIMQRRRSLAYIFKIIEKLNYPIRLLMYMLYSEHICSKEELLSATKYPGIANIINDYLKNPLKLKIILRCLIRKSLVVNWKINALDISQHLKKFLRLECL